jgi:long-chain acyl-CoA synthetase
MRHEAWFGDRVVATFHPRPASVWAMFAGAAQRTPQAEALVCGTTRLTYADCDAASARLCAGLASQGIRPGDRVLLFIDNRPEFVLALLALQRLGAIAVPVGVREQRPGLAYIARQCGAAAIVIDAHLADRAPARRRGARPAPAHQRRGCRRWCARLPAAGPAAGLHRCATAAPPARRA